MSKRTPGMPQRPRGFWPTPREAVVPLIPYLPRKASWGEPCSGDGALVRHLYDLWEGSMHWHAWSSDIEPASTWMHAVTIDATKIEARDVNQVDLWITNPPWPKIGQKGDPALSIILNLCSIAPGWFLLPWDFAANDYFKCVIGMCSDIVPVGRVKWIPDSDGPGKDNCAWYRFDAGNRHPCQVRPRA